MFMNHENLIRGNILIIDDEYAICAGVSGLLKLNGFRTDYVCSGDDGLQYLEQHPETDIVLLDINLGIGKSGIELLPIIRERFKYAQVMMFTSHDTLSTGLECMKKGACDYLTKPFKEAEFLKKVPDALAKKQLSRLNDLYLGILVHDLKNPLQCILGAWDIIKMSLTTPLNESQKRIISSGDTGISQIRMMIENILSVSRFETGNFYVSNEEFCLVDETETVLSPLRDQLRATGRTFSIHVDTNAPKTIVADRDLFTRVLFNIVSNALRFTPDSGGVTIEFNEKETGILHTIICNTGSFVEERFRTEIFDKFASVQKISQSGGVRNFGLGLTFSKMAVEAMGGSIWVESQKEPAQTTFHFTVKNCKAA